MISFWRVEDMFFLVTSILSLHYTCLKSDEVANCALFVSGSAHPNVYE